MRGREPHDGRGEDGGSRMEDGRSPANPSFILHPPFSSPVLLAVVALGVSCVMTQLALMRELLGAFSGNEHPEHKLAHLTPTPVETLVKARDAARGEGLRYVYIGNVPGLEGAETTFCPNCKKTVVERDLFAVTALNLDAGKCRFCGTKIAGVWN